MSEGDKVDMIQKRSELLATVVLTRRLNIDVHPFSDPVDPGINVICTIRPDPDDKVQGFFPFAVIVWGTAKELTTEHEATRYARSRKRMHTDKAEFFMPVIVLLFSMQKDEGFFSWLVKPVKDSNKLLHLGELDFTLFDSRQLDRMVDRIKKWYERMTAAIVVDAGAIDSSQCPGDE
jgi:hypothetical protein